MTVCFTPHHLQHQDVNPFADIARLPGWRRMARLRWRDSPSFELGGEVDGPSCPLQWRLRSRGEVLRSRWLT